MEEFFVDATTLRVAAGITGDFVGHSDSQILTNKKFDDALKLKPVPTPSTDAQYGIFYPDSGDLNKPKFKRPDGTVYDLSLASTGEQNTASNIGSSGVGVWKDKNGVDLRFYKLNSLSAGLSIALDAGNNKIDFNLSGVALLASLNQFTNQQEIKSAVSPQLTLLGDYNTEGSGMDLFFNAKNSVNAFVNYAYVTGVINENSDGVEDGGLILGVSDNGSFSNLAWLDGSGIYLGNSGTLRIKLVDTGLTGEREFSFPDVATKLAGLSALNVFVNENIIRFDTTGPILTLHRPVNSATNAARFDLALNDSASAQKSYARIAGVIVTNTAGAEDGNLELVVRKAGTLTTSLKVRSDGDFEFGSNLRGRFSESLLTTQRIFTPSNTGGVIPIVVAKSGSTTTISNTITETDMLNYSVLQSSMGANGVVRFTITGYILQNQATGTTWRVRIKFGGTTMVSTITGSIAQSATKAPFRIEGEIYNKNAVNAQGCNAKIIFGEQQAGANGIGTLGDDEITAWTPVDSETNDAAIDTSTANRTLQVTIEHSVQNANVQTVIKNYVVELMT